MTTIDTLLTLDADDPALRRGIAEMLGWRIERNEYREKFYVHGPGGKFFDFTYWDIGDQTDDVWLKLEAEEIGPCEPLIPDWPHSVDAALTLIDAEPSSIIISHVNAGWHVGLNTVVSHLKDIGLGEADTPALAICRAWLASKR